MGFFVTPSETDLDIVTEKMATREQFADRYDAIDELRQIDRQGLVPSVGEIARSNGLFRVASLQGPLETLAKVLDPDFLKEKSRFYKWLDRHPQHVAYDRRRLSRPSPNSVTFVDGKEV